MSVAKRPLTRDELMKLATLALEVAIQVPEKRARWAEHAKAYVPWQTIDRIRDQLEVTGIDWRTIVRGRVAAAKARRIEMAEEDRLSQAAREFVEKTPP